MRLSFVIYRSQARYAPREDMMVDILASSVRNNARDGITGFLHVDRDQFLQYLEGPAGLLARRVARIERDRRHRNLEILAEGTIEERFFPDWDMGQLSAALMPATGPLSAGALREFGPDMDPLPLIRGFAAHAGKLQMMEISPVDEDHAPRAPF